MKFQIGDACFLAFINEETIKLRIQELALEIEPHLNSENTLIIGILDGATHFHSDLCRCFQQDYKIAFIKASSYHGMHSTGKVQLSIGDTDYHDQHILIVEDIVDSGKTLELILSFLWGKGAATIKIVSLLFKPETFSANFNLDYVGFTIPDRYVIGYGMDCDGRGRNLRDIYILE
ncbi:MAG: hypoxanthine phosphoribosyltransferase [Bacteroidota bacterium]|nr:hypoxanthine phosphoribosyltransferase [Bacteroidota bacterium]